MANTLNLNRDKKINALHAQRLCDENKYQPSLSICAQPAKARDMIFYTVDYIFS